MTDAAPPVVELRNVSFGFPPAGLAAPVLQDVSLSIAHDDFLGVIGPNGGGKTTLLRIILGLLKPQRGTVRVLGQQPCDARRRIGYVPQHARIDDSVPASVMDVVLTGRLGRSRWGWRYGASDKRAASDALKQTHTDDLSDRPFGELSGGQRQRVLIARALAADAKLLLLDEPTAGVDVHMEQGLVDLLCELNDRLPIVMVSHDISVVSSRLKRVACLSRTLTCHEANEVTQEIIGHMYHAHGPMAVVHHDDASCPVHDHLRGGEGGPQAE